MLANNVDLFLKIIAVVVVVMIYVILWFSTRGNKQGLNIAYLVGYFIAGAMSIYDILYSVVFHASLSNTNVMLAIMIIVGILREFPLSKDEKSQKTSISFKSLTKNPWFVSVALLFAFLLITACSIWMTTKITSFMGNNSWIGFLGGYLGAVIGGMLSGAIAIYVMHKTLKKSENDQIRMETLDFNKEIIQTVADFLERVEETAYSAILCKEISGKDRLDIERLNHFLESKRSARNLSLKLHFQFKLKSDEGTISKEEIDNILQNTQLAWEKLDEISNAVMKDSVPGSDLLNLQSEIFDIAEKLKDEIGDCLQEASLKSWKIKSNR